MKHDTRKDYWITYDEHVGGIAKSLHAGEIAKLNSTINKLNKQLSKKDNEIKELRKIINREKDLYDILKERFPKGIIK